MFLISFLFACFTFVLSSLSLSLSGSIVSLIFIFRRFFFTPFLPLPQSYFSFPFAGDMLRCILKTLLEYDSRKVSDVGQVIRVGFSYYRLYYFHGENAVDSVSNKWNTVFPIFPDSPFRDVLRYTWPYTASFSFVSFFRFFSFLVSISFVSLDFVSKYHQLRELSFVPIIDHTFSYFFSYLFLNVVCNVFATYKLHTQVIKD